MPIVKLDKGDKFSSRKEGYGLVVSGTEAFLIRDKGAKKECGPRIGPIPSDAIRLGRHGEVVPFMVEHSLGIAEVMRRWVEQKESAQIR